MPLKSVWTSLGSIRQWHWMSSAICLVGMLGFAVTGITLNHAADISAVPKVIVIESVLPAAVLDRLNQHEHGDLTRSLPKTFLQWLQREHQLALSQRAEVDWSSNELYVALPQPGGDAWLSVDLASGELLYEQTTRGAISYLNDLHKGRNTGQMWSWFIDLFAAACVVFCITGLVLLYRYAGPRPNTWPLVGLGLVVPLLLVIIFVHP